MNRIILSTLLCAFLLFLFNGLGQLLPWGIPTTQNITVQAGTTATQTNVPNLVRLAPDALTTSKFDNQFLDKISTYTTDKSFSWIITQPLPLNYTGYFVKEAITQLLVGLLLSLILFFCKGLDLKTRLTIVGLAGIAASFGTYGQLMNWWNLPPAYGLGVSFNLVLSWLLVSFIAARFILKSKTHVQHEF